MKCETVSLTRVEKFGKSPEGRVIPYVEIIHKKKCSKELNNLREDEEPEKENVEDEEEEIEIEETAQEEEAPAEDKEMEMIREGFRRFLQK